MIVLITDYGLEGPYIGQVQRVLLEQAPDTPVVNLFADAPTFDPKRSAYLLGAYAAGFAAGTVFMCVVDPGVGTDTHAPVAVQCDRCWFVGPDNGLFEIVRRRARQAQDYRIAWQPSELSASFHGRDLYAPVAACIARGEITDLAPHTGARFAEWPDDLAEIIYIDKYGNAMTGLRADTVGESSILEVWGERLRSARTFGAVSHDHAFWYRNSNGLVEIAMNRQNAALALGLRIGDPFKVFT